MANDILSTIVDNLFYQNPLLLAWWVFIHWGWLVLLVLLLVIVYFRRLNARRYNYVMDTKYVLLAIDVPKDIEANLRAVEQLFAHIHGTDSNPNFLEKWWIGEVQRSISLEIISIDGYIQFLIRTPENFRDLVEAAVYAQYPEAEITEVEDYVNKIELEFPSEELNMYGAEWKLSNKDCFPILTYPFFEHSLSQELADPMASLLEILSRLQNGEQIWIQIVLSPENTKDKWREEGKLVIKKILGDKVSGGGQDWLYFPRQVLHGLSESVTASLIPPSELAASQVFTKEDGQRVRLSPRERTIVESVENKVSKIAYRVKMRILYIAPKEVFSKGKGVNPIKGALKQFAAKDLNSFKEDKHNRTKIEYFFKRIRVVWRQRRLLNRYKKRWNDALSPGFIMTSDELASIYHFPTETVKAPLVKKIESRKSEPPTGLPIETMPLLKKKETVDGTGQIAEPAGEESVPSNLPTE
ncbi:MAG: hypothetical protein ABIB97_01145 [Patescibacteria group bacterium]